MGSGKLGVYGDKWEVENRNWKVRCEVECGNLEVKCICEKWEGRK